jgi:mRNA-degrading endonuclease RelE of RelBE toxin-antitoxin system
MARIGKILIALLLVAGMSSPLKAAEREQGILEVRIKDHRDAIGDFDKLFITIDKISVSPKPGLKFWQTGWKDFLITSEPIDLTKYVGKKTAQVFRAPIETGTFDAFHLKIKNTAGVLNKNQRKALVKNTIGPFKLAYEVQPKTATVLILDLVVTDMSDHPPRGYELSLKGYELFINGKLIEKIPPG